MSPKHFTCFLGCILGLSTALDITSILGVPFLALRCFPWDIWFMRLQSDRPAAFRLLACSLLLCAALVYRPSAAFAQTADSPGEHAHETQPVFVVARTFDQ